MYSSDFPHEVTEETCKEELAELQELDMPREDVAATLGENARNFYRI
jgi:predicted TIM-barrel fold metal-dependent hydrolase